RVYLPSNKKKTVITRNFLSLRTVFSSYVKLRTDSPIPGKLAPKETSEMDPGAMAGTDEYMGGILSLIEKQTNAAKNK
ncbi:unnamed protein product, partial [Amoebophrya sp. A25]